MLSAALATIERRDGTPQRGRGTGPAAVVEAAQSGDRAAFTLLHERFAPMVHGILLTRVPPHDADDLVQEVFLLVLRRLHSLRDPDAFGPWLAVIARNVAARFHRRRRMLALVPLDLAGAGEMAGAVAAPREAREMQEAKRVLDAIRGLPEAYHETLVLRLVERMSGPQIAASTGMTEGSVRVNLHRGMKLLRERLGLCDREGARP